MKTLKNKIAVITGASSGIGEAIAEMLHSHGAMVINISRKSANKPFIASFCCDISDDAALNETVQKVVNQCGKIDFLYLNAGFGLGGGFESADISNIDRMFNVNLLGQIKAVNLFLPHINDGGKIFFTGSLASVIPLPYQACYSASKAGIENFSRALATELKPRKISVCTVMPGDVRTGFTDARIKSTDGSRGQERGIEKMEKSERSGKSPQVVAKTFERLVFRKRLPLRVSVGFDGKIYALIVKLLPVRLTNFLVEKIYI